MRKRFFAQIRDVHSNLRDEHRQRWPSAEIMRKHALINVGYCDSMQVAAGSKAAAPRIADAFKHMDRYCLVDVRDSVLTVFTARSMSRNSLRKPQFHEVAEAALHWIFQQTGIDGRLSEEAKAA